MRDRAMKVFDLVCDDGHRFEGWFASADHFTAQSDASEVRCPLCDTSAVQRAPSAPRLNLHVGASAAPGAGALAARLVDRLRRAVAAADDVGDRFAEEARRIHYEEAPPRTIRGTATDREREALDDEGIETLAIALPAAFTGTLQ